MADNYVSKNYSTDGGDTLVIGGKLVVEDGAEVSGISTGGSSSIPVASTTNLGGVIVGSNLSVTSTGVISYTMPAATTKKLGGVKAAAYQAALSANDLTDVVTAFNALITKLKNAGLMDSVG